MVDGVWAWATDMEAARNTARTAIAASSLGKVLIPRCHGI